MLGGTAFIRMRRLFARNLREWRRLFECGAYSLDSSTICTRIRGYRVVSISQAIRTFPRGAHALGKRGYIILTLIR